MIAQMDKKQVIVSNTDMIEAKKRINRVICSLLTNDSLLRIAILAGYYGDNVRKDMNVENQDWVNFFEVLKERNDLMLSDIDNLESNLPSDVELERNKDSEIAA
ncbi:MAG: hypothetical protein AB1782_09850 [Cyanobacteriota bacterium]